ncbi:MAG: hypothetical protein PVG22_07730 [Chromatiales bacterium]|jgi:hypothetical protein
MQLETANLLWLKIFFLIRMILIGTGVGVTAADAVELYRCTRNGMVEFRQTACPDGEQAITEVIEQSGGISPIEPALRLEPATPHKPHTGHATGQPQAAQERCWKTRQRLEWVERQLRAGYKPSQYEGLHRKQSQYEDYLRRFCR